MSKKLQDNGIFESSRIIIPEHKRGLFAAYEIAAETW